MYIKAIVGYLMWPAMIIVSYYLVKVGLRYFEKNRIQKEGEEE